LAGTAPFDYRPPDGPLQIVHDDDDIVVLDKPSGLLSVPGKTPDLYDCLETRAEARWPNSRIVHRLDMDTSGVIVMAHDHSAHTWLGLQFERRMIEKSYIARVAGIIADNEGAIDLPLRCDWPNRPLQMVCHEHGKPAQTTWRVLEREDGATRVALFPRTGRSHQLRVHMLAIGHPILGDVFYGDPASAPRLQLHAHTLGLRHPADSQWMTFEAPCPF
jgi:tRNA pseudouridine32 synthase/23S rRNA pseudouridine746 synthase